MTYRLLIAAALVGLAGCVSDSSYEQASTLNPSSDHQTFEYVSYSYDAGWAKGINQEWPADDPKAEAKRMLWLEHKLKMNSMCPSGYTIQDRNLVKISEQGSVWEGKITYKGRCK